MEYLIQLAKTQSITQAGHGLFTTQQNVSKMIRQLETEIGASLFTRNKKGVTLTDAGQIMLAFAQRTISDLHETQSTIDSLQAQTLNGSLVLCGVALTTNILGDILQSFTTQYPQVITRVSISNTLDTLAQIVAAPKIMGFSPILINEAFSHIYAPHLESLHLYPLTNDEYVALVGINSPLAKQKSVSLFDLLQQPFISNQSAFGEDTFFKKLFENIAPLRIVFETDSPSLYLQAIINRRGVGIASRGTYLSGALPLYKQLIMLPIQENLHFQVSLIIHQQAALTPIQYAFLKSIHKLYPQSF